jgi:predicted transcriptional regulator of viral defense system
LTIRADIGDIYPYKAMERKVKTSDFLASHPVFSLDEATVSLSPPVGRPGTVERLKHHLETGRLKLVTRGIYSVVPAGTPAGQFQPDPLLVAAAARPDGIFSYHTALELLGAAHSVWSQCTVFTSQRRRKLVFGGMTVQFLDHPEPLRRDGASHMGTLRIERRGKLLEATGPERTLVEGFRRPAMAGGLEELVQSASGFPVLDLDLLEEVLGRYDVANLWAATGWFLDRFQNSFHVPEDVLSRIERHRPRAAQYLERNSRGGSLALRWNLILPQILKSFGGADEP